MCPLVCIRVQSARGRDVWKAGQYLVTFGDGGGGDLQVGFLFEVEAEHDFEATEDYQQALVAGQRYNVIADDTGNGWLQGRAVDAQPG